jgi:chromosome segregation ATPase
LPGSGWTSKNAANTQDSITKYKEKLNVSTGQKGYIDPAVFNLNDDFNKKDLTNIEPKRSCVVEKPECVKYNYVIPEKYLKDGAKNAKIENRILENELDELQAQHGKLQTTHSELQQQHGNLQTRLNTANSELEASRTENREIGQLKTECLEQTKLLRIQEEQMELIKRELKETEDILHDVEIKKDLEINDLNVDIENFYDKLKETSKVNEELLGEIRKMSSGGGTRHKNPRKRTRTHKRRITKRLRFKKIPRKCFSLRKREKK